VFEEEIPSTVEITPDLEVRKIPGYQ
jgi:hypothetical protein